MADVDPVAALLSQVHAPDAVRADAWDAFHQSATADEFAAKVKPLPIPDAVKADLWDLKQATVPSARFTGGNEFDAQGQPVVRAAEPNTVGTLAAHTWQQANPGNLLTAVGQLARHPIDTVKGIGAAQGALFDKAKASYDAGDYVTSARHFINYLLPLIGPGLDKASDEMQGGHYMAGAGDSLGIGLSLFGPQKLAEAAAARYPLAAQTPAGAVLAEPEARPALTPRQAAVQAGQAAGVPVDIATATGNDFLRGTQKLAGKSLGGSVVAKRAGDAQDVAMARYGDRLATEALDVARTPEQAGQTLRDQLASKLRAHNDLADASYERLRALEEDPANRMNVALPRTAPVDVAGAAQPWMVNQMRRIVHELDAHGYTSRTWNDLSGEVGKKGNAAGGAAEIVAGSGGAPVYQDIVERMSAGSNPTRSAVQGELEAYLAGGKETAVVKAALDVARERFRNSPDVSRPTMGPSVFDVPTRLERSRVTSEEMGFPVDLTQAKKVLKPLYDQMTRQMPITQQQASGGLKAIQNILEAPDTGPLSQIDRDLSAIKDVARKQGGLAKEAVRVLDGAVRQAAANGGPDVVNLLEQGRRATIAKVGTQDLIDALPGGKLEEPMPVFRAATAPNNAGLELLRTVQTQTPAAVPTLARAKLEELLAMKPEKAAAEWAKLKPETRQILFPQQGQIPRLDQFFDLGRMLAENPNRSGSGFTVWQGGELAALASHPITALPYSIGLTGLSYLLQSPATVDALNRVRLLSLQPSATAAAKTAAMANLLRLAQQAGIPLETAAATAQSTPPTAPTK